MKLRAASASDSDDLLAWRNDPTTRAMSRSAEPVAPEAHAAWFSRALASHTIRIVIGETQDGKAGMIRIERGKETEVSVNLNPAFRGRGLSLRLLQAAIADEPGVLTAYIRPDNIPSLRLFARAGFAPAGRVGGLERWTRQARTAGNGR